MQSHKMILAYLAVFIVAGIYCAKPKKPMLNELPRSEGENLSEFLCSDNTRRMGTSLETACQGLGGDGLGVNCPDGGRASSLLICSQTIGIVCPSTGEVKRVPQDASEADKADACGENPIIEPEPTTKEFSCADFGDSVIHESVTLPETASPAEIEEACKAGEPEPNPNPDPVPPNPDTGAAAACGTSNPDISAERKVFYYTINTNIRSLPDHTSSVLGTLSANSGNYAVLKCTDSGSQPRGAGYTSWVCINANGVTGWTWVGEFAHKCATLKTE